MLFIYDFTIYHLIVEHGVCVNKWNFICHIAQPGNYISRFIGQYNGMRQTESHGRYHHKAYLYCGCKWWREFCRHDVACTQATLAAVSAPATLNAPGTQTTGILQHIGIVDSSPRFRSIRMRNMRAHQIDACDNHGSGMNQHDRVGPSIPASGSWRACASKEHGASADSRLDGAQSDASCAMIIPAPPSAVPLQISLGWKV